MYSWKRHCWRHRQTESSELLQPVIAARDARSEQLQARGDLLDHSTAPQLVDNHPVSDL